jgi:uncharacterized membrane protein YfcA
LGFIALILIVFIAAFIQGAVGFGLALVSLPFMAMILGLKNSIIALSLSGFLLNATLLWRTRKHFSFDRLIPMMIAVLLAIAPGFCILYFAPDIVLRRTLGIVMLLTVIQRHLPVIKDKRWHPHWLGIPCGIFGGLLQSSIGAGGPPLVAYLSSQKFERHQYIAAVQGIMVIGSCLRFSGMLAFGMFTTGLFVTACCCSIAAIVGCQIGVSLTKRIPEHIFNIVISIMLLVIGIKMLI